MAREIFKNLPDTSTPINANKLNGIFNGVEPMGSIVVEDIIGKNLFDANANYINMWVDTDGSLVDDNIKVNALYDYISVNPLTTYTLSVNQNIFGLRAYGYDENKTFIERFSYGYDLSTIKFTTSENVKYLRILINYDNATKINKDIVMSLEPQLEKGSTATEYTPYKKYGYNSQESMGKIVVDDISCKNIFNIQNPDPYNSVVETMSSNSITFVNSGSYAQLKYHFVLKKNTNYVLRYTLSLTDTSYMPTVDVQGNNSWKNSIISRNGTGTHTLKFNSGDWDTIDMVFPINGATNLTNTGTLSNVQLELGDEVTPYTPYKEFSNEVQYLTNFITAKSGYTIKSQHIFKQNNHFWGNVVIQKDSGTFGSTTEAIATLPTPIQGNVNSGCFMSQGEWSAKNVGYLYIGNNTIQVSDPNATTNNVVKIDLDIVTNFINSTQSASMMSLRPDTTEEGELDG